MNIYKHNEGEDLTQACMKFLIMHNMFTHKTNYSNNRGLNFWRQKRMQKRNMSQDFSLESFVSYILINN